MSNTFIVFALATIAGVAAGYSEDVFRAIVATGIVWIYYEVVKC
jgi:hypothetical protein